MSGFTRNVKAIKRLKILINILINYLPVIDESIAYNNKLKISNSTTFKERNRTFKKLCQLQDILALEKKLNKILLRQTRRK